MTWQVATDGRHGLQRTYNMQRALRNAQRARCNMHLRIDDERSLRPSELKDVRDEAARLPACAADPTAEGQSHLAQSHFAQSHLAQSHLAQSHLAQSGPT